MRVPWKLLGVAGLAGVAASGAVVVRRRRGHQEYDADALRAKLRERLAATRPTGTEGSAGSARSAEEADAGPLAPDRPPRGARRAVPGTERPPSG